MRLIERDMTMNITAKTSQEQDWNRNALSICEYDHLPPGVLLVCIHDVSEEASDLGTNVMVDRTELLRVLRAIEATA